MPKPKPTSTPVQTEMFPNTALAPVAPPKGELTTTDPMVGPTGMEFMPTNNLIIPQLKLLQGINSELIEFDHLKRGMFYHSVFKVGMDQPLRFVPVHIRERVVIFRPEQDGRGVLASASDGVHWDQPNQTIRGRFVKDKWVELKIGKLAANSPLLKFGSSDPSDPSSKPAATRLVELIMVLPDHLDLGASVFTFKRSSLRTGDELFSSFRLAPPNTPIYKYVYRMSWRAVEQDKKQYLVPVPLRDGLCDGELLKFAAQECSKFHNLAMSKSIVVDEDYEEEAPPVSESPNLKRDF